MSFIDSGMDLIVKKFAGKDTIRIEPDQLLQIVQEEFIFNADEKRLDFLYKMAKGWFLGRKLLSKKGIAVMSCEKNCKICIKMKRGECIGRKNICCRVCFEERL